MTHDTKVQELAELFRQTAKAHHEAFIEVDGDDPEWALWYAEYLHERIRPFLASTLTKSRLVVCLVGADSEHRAAESEVPWPEHYARHILECLGPAEAPDRDSLALYHFDGCPFCRRVRRAIDALGIDVELRNIYDDPAHLEALIEARGRATVPVLRVSGADGAERWMPESADIVRYLHAVYGEAAA